MKRKEKVKEKKIKKEKKHMAKDKKSMLLRSGLLVIISVIVCLLIVPLFKSLNFGLDLQGGFEILYEVSPIDGSDMTQDKLNATYKSMLKRIDTLGVSEPEITLEGNDKIRVKLAGVTNKDEARETLSTVATLTFRDSEDNLLMSSDVLEAGGARLTTDTNGRPAVSLAVKDKNTFYKINFDKKNSLSGFNFGREYIAKNNFNAYFKELNGANDRQLLNSLKRWQSTLNKTAELFKDKESKNLDCYDLGLLLTLTEISQSIYFKGWTKIQDWNSRVQSHFERLISVNSSGIDIPMSITDFKIGKRVVHKSFGSGQIVSINNLRVVVLFDTGAEREFGLTVGRKFFSVERERTGNINEIIERLYINPMGYGEWIAFISILKLYGSLYNEKLVEII